MTHKTHFRGVKKDSVLTGLQGFIVPTMIAIDPMHVVFLGVVNDFLLMWLGIRKLTFVKKRWKESQPWIMSQKAKQGFMADVGNIKFPLCVNRSAHTDIEHWNTQHFYSILHCN